MYGIFDLLSSWIPWNLSFRYILFHEKRLQTKKQTLQAGITANVKLCPYNVDGIGLQNRKLNHDFCLMWDYCTCIEMKSKSLLQ